MHDVINWFLDFDDTLVTGSLTWAMESAFPKLISEHGLSCDLVQLDQAVLKAQRDADHNVAPERVVHELFATMGWPEVLEQALFSDILSNYQPTLFEDTLPFLEQLRTGGCRAFIISNNPRSVASVERLNIGDYFTDVITPKRTSGLQAKPNRHMWDFVVSNYSEVTEHNSVFVGDDPWSDGEFAHNCGLPCRLIDRRRRFTSHESTQFYHWAASLLEIPLQTK